MGETNNFPGLKNETETETFNFGLMEPRPRPRLSFWVSWNRDRDRDFNMKSRETETFTRPDILSLGGTETTKVSEPRVSAQRPPISGPNAIQEPSENKFFLSDRGRRRRRQLPAARPRPPPPPPSGLRKWLEAQPSPPWHRISHKYLALLFLRIFEGMSICPWVCWFPSVSRMVSIRPFT